MFLLILPGILFILAGCQKSESSDPPPEVKDPYGMFTYTIKANGVVLFVNTSENATSYLWDFGDLTTSTTNLTSFEHQYVQNGTFKAHLTAYGNGKSAGAFANLEITSVAGGVPTVETIDVTDISQTGATSGGNITSEGSSFVTAKGVCWSMSQNPTISDNKTMDGDGGINFTSSITGLTANTPYFVRAYSTNSSGTAYGEQKSFTTTNGTSANPCPGMPTITISHVAGNVAPVDKTVTYGTVTNIPGEPSKCWITSNLGADHQAASVGDLTEASAGWYWQFNQMQGFKHDGTTRTPNTTWIDWINDDFDWQPGNDPCSLELGNGWRIPTYTEWNNVFVSGSWSNWDDPWNSALKLHAAGQLFSNDGTLYLRGANGEYWAGTQYNSLNGWQLQFNDVSMKTTLHSPGKSNGFSLRCLKALVRPDAH